VSDGQGRTGLMSERTDNWIAAYRTAWESNAPDDIRALFTENASYRTKPHAEPWVGHDGIVAGWREAADEPGDATFDWHLVAETGDLAFVEGVTRYRDDEDYSNLWIIEFAPDGRATGFTEWWMTRPSGV